MRIRFCNKRQDPGSDSKPARVCSQNGHMRSWLQGDTLHKVWIRRKKKSDTNKKINTGDSLRPCPADSQHGSRVWRWRRLLLLQVWSASILIFDNKNDKNNKNKTTTPSTNNFKTTVPGVLLAVLLFWTVVVWLGAPLHLVSTLLPSQQLKLSSSPSWTRQIAVPLYRWLRRSVQGDPPRKAGRPGEQVARRGSHCWVDPWSGGHCCLDHTGHYVVPVEWFWP